MKILVSGYKGLIGSHIYDRLQEEGHEVYAFDRDGIKGDEMLPDKLDFVIHTAANTFIRETIKNPALARENINITLDMFELARAKEADMIYFSSSRAGHPFINPYVMSKVCGEEISESYEQTYGIRTLTIRPETIWGYTKDDRVMMKWIRQALNNEDITIYGGKNKEIPPLYIEEFMNIFMMFLNNFDYFAGKIISVSGQIRKAVDIAETIQKVIGGTAKYKLYEPEELQPQECFPSDIVGKSDLKSEVREVIKKIKDE